jgi:hypothetical protein
MNSVFGPIVFLCALGGGIWAWSLAHDRFPAFHQVILPAVPKLLLSGSVFLAIGCVLSLVRAALGLTDAPEPVGMNEVWLTIASVLLVVAMYSALAGVHKLLQSDKQPLKVVGGNSDGSRR